MLKRTSFAHATSAKEEHSETSCSRSCDGFLSSLVLSFLLSNSNCKKPKSVTTRRDRQEGCKEMRINTGRGVMRVRRSKRGDREGGVSRGKEKYKGGGYAKYDEEDEEEGEGTKEGERRGGEVAGSKHGFRSLQTPPLARIQAQPERNSL